MRGNRLAQAVYGKGSLVLPSRCNLSIVVSDPRSHHRRCGLDPTAVSPAPPFSQVFKTLPTRSTAPANVACARWLQGRRSDLEAARHSRGASQLRMLGKMVSRYTWGSCDRATRGHFCLSPPAGSFTYAFADRRQPANPSIGPVLFHQRVELLPQEVLQQLMENATVMAHGIDPLLVSGSFPNNPGPVEAMPCARTAKMYRTAARRCRACGRIDI
jgi:hypothetical protein